MRIILDAMGGDNAPKEIVLGALNAMENMDVEIVLVGRENEIMAVLEAQGITSLPSRMYIEHTDDVVSMSDDPVTVIKEHGQSSLVTALKMLADDKGDAFISAGNTGAIITGATLIVKRIRGVRRAALGIEFPSEEVGKNTLIVDIGANAECTPEYLLQFAVMGSFYMKNQYAMKTMPTVRLLNNGAESSKGTEMHKQTYQLLKKADENGIIRFEGNAEARDVFTGCADVIVTDGFSGNIMLKTAEGTVGYMMDGLKEAFMSGLRTKTAYLLVRHGLKTLKKKMDYKEVGGTPLLGISKPVIKAHGSSNAKAIYSAIKQAVAFASGDFIDNITESIHGSAVTAGKSGE